jgi:hypothetical protein
MSGLTCFYQGKERTREAMTQIRKEQAKALRDALKAEMPEVKFEVRFNTHGGWNNTLDVFTNLETLDCDKFWSIASKFNTHGLDVSLESRSN